MLITHDGEKMLVIIHNKSEENHELESEFSDFEGDSLTVLEGKFAEQDFQKVERSVEI